MGAKSPLLWDKGQVDSLLAGSPVVNMVKERLKVLPFLPCCPVCLAKCRLFSLKLFLPFLPCCLSTLLPFCFSLLLPFLPVAQKMA